MNKLVPTSEDFQLDWAHGFKENEGNVKGLWMTGLTMKLFWPLDHMRSLVFSINFEGSVT